MDLPDNIKIFFSQGDKTFNIYGIVSVEHFGTWVKIINKQGSEHLINMSNVNLILAI